MLCVGLVLLGPWAFLAGNWSELETGGGNLWKVDANLQRYCCRCFRVLSLNGVVVVAGAGFT